MNSQPLRPLSESIPVAVKRREGVTPRSQTSQGLDSLKSSATAAGQRANGFRKDPAARREAVDQTVRTITDRGRSALERGFRAMSNNSLKAADYLKTLDKQGAHTSGTGVTGQIATRVDGAVPPR